MSLLVKAYLTLLLSKDTRIQKQSVPQSVSRLLRNRPAIGICTLIAAVLASCATPHNDRNGQDSAAVTKPTSQTLSSAEQIPPSQCRIRATVVSIDSTLSSSDTSNPCSRFPCSAKIRVDSVLGYGAGFDRPLAPGETIPVTFAFTLKPITLSSLKETLPGLQIGSSFTADLQGGSPSPAAKETEQSFVIYSYQTGPPTPQHK
jgi:hypothetical protein